MSSFAISSSTTPQQREQWNVTGRDPTRQEADEIPEHRTNCMARYVKWLKTNDHAWPTLHIAIVAIAAVGYFYSTLLALGIGIPLFTWYITEWNHHEKIEGIRDRVIRRREREIQETLQEEASFRSIQEAVGGEEAFNQLPVLDLGERVGPTGYIDFLRVDDLSAPVMRGTDCYGRPFVSLHLQCDGEDRVVTFFQRYARGGMWSTGGAFDIDSLHHFGEETLRIIRQIVVEQNHPTYSLVSRD